MSTRNTGFIVMPPEAFRAFADMHTRYGTTPPMADTTIRAWAAENGYHVNDRGRLPNDVVAAYKATHGRAANPATLFDFAEGGAIS